MGRMTMLSAQNMGNPLGNPYLGMLGLMRKSMAPPPTPTSYALNLNSGKQEAQYAMGGPVSFADGGDSNKEDALGLPSLSPDMSMDPNAGAGNLAMLQSAMQPTQGMQGNAPMTQSQMPDQSNDSLIAKVTANLKVDPNYQPENPIEAAIVKQIKGTDPMQQGQPSLQGLGSLAPGQPMAPSFNPSQSMAPSFNPSVAMGPTYFAGINAPQGYAEGGETSLNLDRLPSLNLNTGTNSSGQSEGFQRVLTGFGELSERGPSPGHRRVGDAMYRLFSYDPVLIDMIRGGKAPQGYAEGGETSLNLDRLPSLNLNTGTNSSIVAVANTRPKFSFPSMGRMGSVGIGIQGGINPRPWYEQQAQYAQGGYLDGQGDGMSDSIPATIEGKQPARLADGEFVVPADVVSHLGNGSSKAGSKRLYAMLDKVRHARTGNKKQGKEIKADKFLPA
jgi:hypothetical protein